MTARSGATATSTPLPAGLPPCEACGGDGGEVWPCPFCGQRLHVECGHGIEYRPATWPPRQIDGEPVLGAWHCTDCAAVAGYDIAEPEGSDRS